MAIAYTPPIRDIEFALEAAGASDTRYDAVANVDVLRDGGKDMRQQLLEMAGNFAANDLLKLYQHKGHVRFENGQVTMPEGYEQTYQAYVDSGIPALTAPETHGGMALPKALDAAVGQMLFAGNNTFSMIRVLNKSVYEGIAQNAKDAEKGNTAGKLDSTSRDAMLKNLASGQWSGVMALTEPDAGSDLSNIRTKASLQNDGSYKLQGGKYFITAADNDYTTLDKHGNIIHLVLVKIDGEKELSLMAVPKLLFDQNGKPTEKNHIQVVGIEEKMGMKHSATCTVDYSGAKGWLVGERGKGMTAMFDVMNEARRQVGRQSIGMADIAYQNALAYAKDRRQGRALHGSEHPGESADPILVHPGVRNMLLQQRAFVEGARVFDFLTEMEADLHQDKEAKQWVELVTNMVKSHFSEQAWHSIDQATRVHGGSGYVRETGIEEYLRDAWILRTYEGTNQIQAVAQVGRHLDKFRDFRDRVQTFIDQQQPEAKPYTSPLQGGLNALMESVAMTAEIRGRDKTAANAAAEDLMKVFGTVAIGYAWARSAVLAQEKLKHTTDRSEKAFLEEKLETANFYMQRVLLPQIYGQHTAISYGITKTLRMGSHIRRQEAPIAEQLATTDVTGMDFGKRGLTESEVVLARVQLANLDPAKLSEAHAADAERALEQIKLDFSAARNGNPFSEQVRGEVKGMQRVRAIEPNSGLGQWLQREQSVA